MSKEEIEHDYTKNLICPYCGYEDKDTWESGVDEGGELIDCQECGKEYFAVQNVLISYSTKKQKQEV